MALMDDMKDRLSHAGRSTVQKAKDLSEVARLNTMISDAECQIIDLYGKIGYEVYAAYCERPLPEVAGLIDNVSSLRKSIESCKARIEAINAANTCPNCGAKVRPKMVFCSGCGYKLPQVEPLSSPEPTVFCGSCGAPAAADDVFCTSCGKKIV